jgi:hypothetical protein
VTPTPNGAPANRPERELPTCSASRQGHRVPAMSFVATAFAERSTQVRQANKRVRHALANGQLTIADVMRDPPPELADRALFEILLLARGLGRTRLRELNERAIEEGVNLAVTLDLADESTRRWVAANALRSTRLAVWDRLML